MRGKQLFTAARLLEALRPVLLLQLLELRRGARHEGVGLAGRWGAH